MQLLSVRMHELLDEIDKHEKEIELLVARFSVEWLLHSYKTDGKSVHSTSLRGSESRENTLRVKRTSHSD